MSSSICTADRAAHGSRGFREPLCGSDTKSPGERGCIRARFRGRACCVGGIPSLISGTCSRRSTAGRTAHPRQPTMPSKWRRTRRQIHRSNGGSRRLASPRMTRSWWFTSAPGIRSDDGRNLHSQRSSRGLLPARRSAASCSAPGHPIATRRLGSVRQPVSRWGRRRAGCSTLGSSIWPSYGRLLSGAGCSLAAIRGPYILRPPHRRQ